MQIHPIKTEQDHREALARIDQIFSAALDTPEGDELDILVTLVDAYETKHYPIPLPTPIAAIKFRMDQQGLTRKDLEPLIGTRARVSEVLSGKRPLTLAMVRRLRDHLAIPADLLIASVPQHTRSATDRKRKQSARVKPTNRLTKDAVLRRQA